jgi:hypothetical protein
MLTIFGKIFRLSESRELFGTEKESQQMRKADKADVYLSNKKRFARASARLSECTAPICRFPTFI